MASNQPTFLDFLNSVPAPLTTALVGLAPQISRIRRWGETLSWKGKGRWNDSWLLLFAWWALCLLSDPILRHFLPVLLGSAFFVASRRPRAPPTVVTEENLQTCIADLNMIHAMIPHIPRPPPLSLKITFRVSTILLLPFLAMTHFVRLRILAAIFGTVFLTYRAPWARTMRRSLAASAHLRWLAYKSWSLLAGVPLPVTPVKLATVPDEAQSVRFLFMVHENQRWWVGLDWTTALLPAERPPWCSPAQTALPSPNTFTLPEDTTIYLPAPNDPTKRVKRTARWRWEETEWKVLVRAEGGDISRVERTVPKDKEEPQGSRLMKAAHKMRETPGEATSGTSHAESGPEELATDADGWLYGDNKWEGQNKRGGMGKYTRHRKWTRVAVISETIHIVDAAEEPPREPTHTRIESNEGRGRASSMVQKTRKASIGAESVESKTSVGSLPIKADALDDGSRLRQRLKNALHEGSSGDNHKRQTSG